ncbi:MAG TPA: hypothetical protein VHG89_10885 [Verrucomicrobiae bacterium]|nr:hypothetical protein [Verrucomicrobiae bacterium]
MNPKLILCLALVLSNVATAVFSQTNNGSSLTPQEIAKKSLDAYAALTSYSDTGKTVESGVGQTVTTTWNSQGGLPKRVESKTKHTNTTTFSIRMQRPNLFRVLWTQTNEGQTNCGSWWSDSDTNFGVDQSYFFNGMVTNTQPEIIWIPMALTTFREASGAVAIIPAIFLKLNPGDNILTKIADGELYPELGDEKAGDSDCYVLSITRNSTKIFNMQMGKTVTRLWIGKSDYLLRQIQSIYDPPQTQTNSPSTNFEETVFIQTHENISVNEKYPAAEFEFPKIPPVSSSVTLSNFPPTPNAPHSLREVTTNGSDITILSAEFGVGAQVINVADRVSKLLSNRADGFTVNAKTLGADPLPGKKKRLVIRYNFKGTNCVLTVPATGHVSYEILTINALK